MAGILVTGASGFVGRALVGELVRRGHQVTAAGRTAPAVPEGKHIRSVATGRFGPDIGWQAALAGCSVVIHLAAQVPAREIAPEMFAEANDQGTRCLATAAEQAGIKRFVHLSSLFAVAEGAANRPVDEMTPPAPSTPYGRSKLAAEAHVRAINGINLRPPVVYGTEARGNWAALRRLAGLAVPLPFASVRNRRSLLFVDNLVSALLLLIELPEERFVPGTYMIADAEPVGLAEILSTLRHGFGVPPRLFAVPTPVLRSLLTLARRDRMAKTLLDDLEVDSTRFRHTFDWQPPTATLDGIRLSAQGAVG